jgi:type IV pilus assembly protein PilV
MGAMRSFQGYRNDMDKAVRNPRKEKGFTLIEVLFAIAILAFGLLAVASMQSSAIHGNLFASGKTQGITWAENTMEELLALPYAQVVSGGPITEGNYNISWAVNAGPVANSKLITVTVTYQERGIQRQAIRLTCIKPAV